MSDNPDPTPAAENTPIIKLPPALRQPQAHLTLYSAIAGKSPVFESPNHRSPVARLLTMTRRQYWRPWTTRHQRRRLRLWVKLVQVQARHHLEQVKSRLAA